MKALGAVALSAALLACGGKSEPLALDQQAQAASGLQPLVERAADLEGVPRPLLVAIGWADSRLSMRAGRQSLDGAYGLCNLVERDAAPPALSLDRAARLTGLPAASLRTDAFANARGAAALLREQADALFAQYKDLHEERLADWYAAVLRLAGSDDPFVADGFARQVYAVLQDGLSAQDERGQPVRIAAQEIDLTGRTLGATAGGGEYCPGGACVAFVPAASANFAAGRGGQPISLIVIHDMEGSYSSTIGWFQNPASQVSAHFDLRSSDGQITQQVRDADTAWHAGNHVVNAEAVGLEHEGYAAQGATWYTDAMYRSSAALTRWLCDTYSIPKDRQHIIGHYEVPDLNHAGWYGGASHHHDPCDVWAGDPTWHNVSACAWDWTKYMALVTGGGGPPPPPPPATGLANGGFESGLTGWTRAGSTAASASGCHGGTGCATAGAATATSGDSTLSQTFTVPAGKTTLSAWYALHCPDTVTYDWATITLKDNGSGVTATLLPKTCTKGGAWASVSAPVAAGHSYALTLLSHDDGYAGDPTFTLFDDVTLR